MQWNVFETNLRSGVETNLRAVFETNLRAGVVNFVCGVQRTLSLPVFSMICKMERNQILGELIPCGGGDNIPLLKPKLLVGRRSSCDISLRFPNVSSHHCELELINGYWHVRDLNSRNGIKINGERCAQKWLMPGDILSVARHQYEVSYEPASDAPPPEDADPFAVGLLEKAGLLRHKPSEKESAGEASPAGQRPEQWKPEAADDDPVMRWLSGDAE